MPWFEISIAVSELVAVYLIWRVWKSNDYLIFKISYTVLAIVPFIGPLIVLWSANIPSRQHPAFQDRERYRTDVVDRWRHVLDERNAHVKFHKWQQLGGKKEGD